MNIFGVGGAELIAIFVIMLVFAGPKRMIHWSYVMGTYVSRFRKMWSQTVDLVQKEFDEAGVNIKLPKEPPTRQNLNKALGDAVKPMTAPLEQSISEVNKDMDAVREVSGSLKNTKLVDKTELTGAHTATPPAAKPKKVESASSSMKTPAAVPQDLGAWNRDQSNQKPESNANGQGVDLGAWSNSAKDA